MIKEALINLVEAGFTTFAKETRLRGFRDVPQLKLMKQTKFNYSASEMDFCWEQTRLGESDLSRHLQSVGMDVPMLITVDFDFLKVEYKKALQGLRRNPEGIAYDPAVDNWGLVLWYWRSLATVRLAQILSEGLTLNGDHYSNIAWQSSSQAKANQLTYINDKYAEYVKDFATLGLEPKEKIGKYMVRPTLALSGSKPLFEALPKMEEYFSTTDLSPEHCSVIPDLRYKTVEEKVMHVHDGIEEDKVLSWEQKVTDGGAIGIIDDRDWSDEMREKYIEDANRGEAGIFSGRVFAAGKVGFGCVLRTAVEKLFADKGMDPAEASLLPDNWGRSLKLADASIVMGTSGWKYSNYNLTSWDDAIFRMSVRGRDTISVCVVPHAHLLDLSYQASQYLYLDGWMTHLSIKRSEKMLKRYETDKGVIKLVMPEMKEAVKAFPNLMGDEFVARMVESSYEKRLLKALTSLPKVAEMRMTLFDPAALLEMYCGVEPAVRIKANQCIIPGAPVGWVLACRYPVSGATWKPLYNIGVPEGMEGLYSGYAVYTSIEGTENMRLQMDQDGDKLIVVLPSDDFNRQLIDFVKGVYEDGVGLTCYFDVASDDRPFDMKVFKRKMLESESSQVGIASDAQALVNLNTGEQDYTLQKAITALVDMGKGAKPDADTAKAEEISAGAYEWYTFPGHVKLSKNSEETSSLFEQGAEYFQPEAYPNSWHERYAHDLAEQVDLHFDWSKITVPEWIQYKPGQKAEQTPSWKMLCCGNIKKLSLYASAKAVGDGLLDFSNSVFGRKINAIRTAELQMLADEGAKYKCVSLVDEEIEAARKEIFAIAEQRGVTHEVAINSLVMEIYQSGDSDQVKDNAKRILWKCFGVELTNNIKENLAAGSYPDIVVPQDLFEDIPEEEEVAALDEEPDLGTVYSYEGSFYDESEDGGSFILG